MKRQIHNLAEAEVFGLLRSNPRGLSSAEAARRAREVGPNTLSPPPRFRALRLLVKQFTNLFSLLLDAAALLCFVADRMQPGEGMGLLGFALLGVALLNALFTFAQEMRAERAMDALRKMLPQHVRVLRDGAECELSAPEIVPGDVLVLSEGDRIVADARLFEASGLLVNNAPLTGESRSVSLRSEAVKDGMLVESHNLVLAGCSVLRGSGRAVVFATGRFTEFGKIAALSVQVTRPPSPIERELARMIRILTVVATAMGVAFFAYGVARGRPLWVNLVFMMGIIVANVPEGLLPTFTLSLAMGAVRLARKNVLVKSLSAVESLGSVQVICTDKTGTLTRNELALVGLFAADGTPLDGDRTLLECALGACQLHEASGKPSGDPLDVAIARALPDAANTEVLRPIPFDVQRRRAAGIVRRNAGLELCVKGAWEALAPMLSTRPRAADATMRRLASEGKRVIAVARRGLRDEQVALPLPELEQGLELLGFACFADPLREEVPDAVQRCHQAGIRVLLVTGDHPDTARAIAASAGIVASADESAVLTGDVLERATEAGLIERLGAGVRVFARTTPEQKLKIVSALKRMGLLVAMTGDGVNDAPALRAADVGVAMGASGTDVAREAGQIVLLDDNFASIVAGVEEGRTVFSNMRKFTTYVLASNVPEIVPFLAYVLLPVPLALTVIQILAIDLGTDMIPAIGLGREPPDGRVMSQPPRGLGARLLSFALMRRAYLFIGLIEAALSMALFFTVLVLGGWHFGEELSVTSSLYRSATGLTLASIVLMQIGNLVGRRSETSSGLDRGLLANPLFGIGIGLEIAFALAALYAPPIARFLKTGPVPAELLALAVAGPLLLFGADWLRKRLTVGRRRPARGLTYARRAARSAR